MKQEKSVKAHTDVLNCISGDSSTSTNIVTGKIIDEKYFALIRL